MKIYTKRGDRGETDLLGGDRVTKDHLRVEAYGEVDELNAAIGVAVSLTDEGDLREDLQSIQSVLFDLGSLLATPTSAHREKMGLRPIGTGDIDALENCVDRLEGELEPLVNFILPGGTPAGASFHAARTICRRAERRAVALDREVALPPELLRYLNRLSDLLFVMARAVNRRAGVADIPWVGRER